MAGAAWARRIRRPAACWRDPGAEERKSGRGGGLLGLWKVGMLFRGGFKGKPKKETHVFLEHGLKVKAFS